MLSPWKPMPWIPAQCSMVVFLTGMQGSGGKAEVSGWTLSLAVLKKLSSNMLRRRSCGQRPPRISGRTGTAFQRLSLYLFCVNAPRIPKFRPSLQPAFGPHTCDNKASLYTRLGSTVCVNLQPARSLMMALNRRPSRRWTAS